MLPGLDLICSHSLFPFPSFLKVKLAASPQTSGEAMKNGEGGVSGHVLNCFCSLSSLSTFMIVRLAASPQTSGDAMKNGQGEVF